MQESKLHTLLSLSQLTGITLSEPLAHALESMKKCRTQENGGRILFCPACKTKIVLYNPCNKRGCPICYRKNQVQWQKKAERKILPVTHYHLTFSIPEHYTDLWLRNKELVMETLFTAVKEAVGLIGKESGLLLGSLLAYQSHGRGMCYKPHMHCVLSGGGLDCNKKWIKLGSIPLRQLEEKTEAVFEEEIHKRLPKSSAVIDTTAKKKQYRVYIGIHKGSGRKIIEYLSRTRNGVVIDMDQELVIDEETIEFKEIDGYGERKTRLRKITFIERYFNHIPPEGSVVARYYGLYSNRHKDDLRIAKEQVCDGIEEDIKPYRELCPKCKTELLVIEIIESNESHKFFKYGRNHDPPQHGDIISVA